MKKLISLLLVIFLGFVTFAQEISRPSSSTYNTFSRNDQRINYSYWDYEGVATDLLIETTSDTIEIRYQVKKHNPYSAKVISKFDPILGADTTVVIYLLGRNSTDEDWVAITNTTSAAVAADDVVTSLSSATAPTFTATIATYDITEAAYNGVLTMDTTELFPAYDASSPAKTDSTFLYTGTTINASHVSAVGEQTITLAQTSTLLEYRYLLVRYIIEGDDSVGTGIELKRTELKIYEH